METSWGVVTTTAPSTRAAFRNCARETFKVMPFFLFIWVRTAGQQGGGLGRGGGGGSPRRVAAACGPGSTSMRAAFSRSNVQGKPGRASTGSMRKAGLVRPAMLCAGTRSVHTTLAADSPVWAYKSWAPHQDSSPTDWGRRRQQAPGVTAAGPPMQSKRRCARTCTMEMCSSEVPGGESMIR